MSLIGQTLDRYHILDQLGEGGMATVYKALDTRLDSEVAVKVIRIERLSPDVLERAMARFEREAKAQAKLTHPNIVKVTDYGEYQGRLYLVMPFLPGGTLKHRLGKLIPWQKAARLLIPIARALATAHGLGMIHRDVKPANILITEDSQPMISDFGVAKVMDVQETVDLTSTGMGVGTPEYMAPEQFKGQVDDRSDIYALGVVFYEMVTGGKPYTADTPAALIIKQATDPLPRPMATVPSLPSSVEQVLLKALAKDPTNRYQNMLDFATEMERLMSNRRRSSSTLDITKSKRGHKFSLFSHLPQITITSSIVLSAIFLALVIVVFFGVRALVSEPFIPTAIPDFAYIANVSGITENQMRGKNSYKPIYTGDYVVFGQGSLVRVSTGVAEFSLPDLFRVYAIGNENNPTIIEFFKSGDLLLENDVTIIRLLSGTIIVTKTEASASNIRLIVETNSGDAKISGAVMGIRYNFLEQIFDVDCFVGKCLVLSENQSYNLIGGEHSWVDASGNINMPNKLNYDDYNPLAEVLFTPTETFTPVPDNTPHSTIFGTYTPWPTSTYAVPTIDPTTSFISDQRDVQLTATMGALFTQQASNLLTVTPITTQLPSASFADDVGLPGLLALAGAMILMIFLARRLRRTS